MLKFKHQKTGLFLALVICFFSQKILANNAKISVSEVKFSQQNRLEIPLSKKTDFRIFTLKNPDRLVIDIANANFEKPDEQQPLPSFASSFRSKKSDGSLRLVFDLKEQISIQKIKQENSGKITAEILGAKTESKTTAEADFIGKKIQEFEVKTEKIVNPDGSAKYIVKKIPKNQPASSRIPIIVIDSGHGGKDPGTIGNFARTKEKHLTLSYAKELGKQLINSKRYKVYLTRDDDNFISLSKRVAIARKKKADLFISLHANAISDSEVAGFSIYTLSEKSSDRQAELLAQKENQADILNGINFSGASKDVVKTLIDLSQRESMNGSAHFANIVINSVRNSEINILQNTHRFAGFAVLTAPDMISVLIELGYLSNKSEEKLLSSLSYKRKLAASLVAAIDEYFSKNKL